MSNYPWFDSAMEPVTQVFDIILIIFGYGSVGLICLGLIAGAILGTVACVGSEAVHAWLAWVKERVSRDRDEEERARDVEMTMPVYDGNGRVIWVVRGGEVS